MKRFKKRPSVVWDILTPKEGLWSAEFEGKRDMRALIFLRFTDDGAAHISDGRFCFSMRVSGFSVETTLNATGRCSCYAQKCVHARTDAYLHELLDFCVRRCKFAFSVTQNPTLQQRYDYTRANDFTAVLVRYALTLLVRSDHARREK